jgi:hypothetical protein
MHARFWCENLKERELMKDHKLDGRVILKVYQKGIGLEGVGWIYLACSMDK